MSKILKIFYILLLAISCVFTVLFYAGAEEVIGDDVIPVFTSSFLVWGYILAAFAVIVSLVFPLIQMITSPKGSKKTFIYLIAIIAIFVLSYMLAPGNPVRFTGAGMDKFNVPSLLKNVDTGIIATYIFMGIAFIAMIYAEVSKAIR